MMVPNPMSPFVHIVCFLSHQDFSCSISVLQLFYFILLIILTSDLFIPALMVSLARRVEPAQRIVKAELVDYPQDEGPIRRETSQQSKICSLQ